MLHKVKAHINRVIVSMCFVLLAESCLAAYTNLPNMANNRLASAAAGQIASQHLDISSTQSMILAPLKSGALVGLLDVMIRETTSELLECPTQSYSEMMTTAGSSAARAMVSGLLYSFLLHRGHKINPILYSGIYAASDTLMTVGFNIPTPLSEDEKRLFIKNLAWDSIYQGIFAMAFSSAGMAIAQRFPTHKYPANMITQLSLIYGTAIAYITYIELQFAFAELKSLG